MAARAHPAFRAGDAGLAGSLTPTPISNAAVYIWHCDKDGLYSGYDTANNAGQAGLTYMRGIQVSDAAGRVTFKTIIPGWYPGRIAHIHFLVILNNNTSGTTAVVVSQLAFPEALIAQVYSGASALYTKGLNTSVASNAADQVFADGTSTQMGTYSGSIATGFVGGLVLGVNVNNSSSLSGGGTPPTGTPPVGTPPGGTPPGGTPPGG